MTETPKIETVFDDAELHIGQVYATALLEVAGKNGQSDTVVEEINSIVNKVLNQSPQLAAIFQNPRIDGERKSSMIDRLFHGKVSDTSLKFLKVLARRGRLGSLKGIASAATSLQDEAAGRMQVEVTTAQPMDANQLNALRDRLQQVLAAEVRITTKVNPDILGGLVVRVGDTVYDASVDGRLNTMKRKALQQAEAAIRGRITELAS